MKWLKRYDLPSVDGLEGWATIVLGSDGFFAAVSDYGNYAFRWSNAGVADFREFFARERLSPDYMLSKLSRRDVWDATSTLAEVKRVILDARRCRAWSATRARDEWDLLERFGQLDSREEFALWLEHTQIDEAWRMGSTMYPHDARAFVTKTLPRLAKVLQGELAAECAEVRA